MRQGFSAALLLLAIPANADEVWLKSGGRISGVVLEQTDARVVLQAGPGIVAVPRSSVVRVVQKQSALQLHAERAARLSGADKEGWLDLALWCRDQGLDTQAREAFLRVLGLDPANPMAQAGIGKIWMNNRWLSEDEAHRARGDVYFEGSWVSPEEREDRVRERADRRADELARREADARVAEAEARAREADAAARRAEADANSGGIPYGWGGWGGGYVGGGGGYVNGRGSASGRGYGAGRSNGGYAPAATGHRGAHAAPVAVPVTRDIGRTSHGEAPPRRN